MPSFIKLGFVASIGLLMTLPAAAQQISPQANPSTWVALPPVGTLSRPIGLYAWSGAGSTNTYYGGFGGFLWALNGNLASDGFIIRGETTGGGYRYVATGFPHEQVDTVGAGVLLGYRKSIGSGWLTGYVGGNFEEHDNPDPAAPIRGTHGGVKGLVEYYQPLNDKFDVSGSASYSTAFSTATVSGRLGYKLIDNLKIGPEITYASNVNSRDSRVGSFISHDTQFGVIVLSGGYVKPLVNNPDGYYANIQFGFAIR